MGCSKIYYGKRSFSRSNFPFLIRFIIANNGRLIIPCENVYSFFLSAIITRNYRKIVPSSYLRIFIVKLITEINSYN